MTVRLLVTTHGGAGHFHPLAAIADAALAEGVDVAFAVEPPFDRTIAGAGYAVFPMGMPFDFNDPESTFPELGRRRGLDGAAWAMANVFFGSLADAALDDVESIVERWRPDVVLHETSEVAGLLAAERAGLPHATFNYGGLDLAVLRWIAGEAWDQLRRRHGMAADEELRTLADAAAIAALPASWAGEGGAARVCRVALAGRDDLGAPSDSAPSRDGLDPVVYGTLGTVNADAGALGDLVAGLGLTGLPALVTTGHRLRPDHVATTPPEVQIRSYVPNSVILASCRAVVHHGGFNTLLGALRHGLPQVIVPLDADQPINAARAGELGLAVVLPPEERTADTIAGAVRLVLDDPSYAERARAMRADIEGLPPVGHAVAELIELAGC